MIVDFIKIPAWTCLVSVFASGESITLLEDESVTLDRFLHCQHNGAFFWREVQHPVAIICKSLDMCLPVRGRSYICCLFCFRPCCMPRYLNRRPVLCWLPARLANEVVESCRYRDLSLPKRIRDVEGLKLETWLKRPHEAHRVRCMVG